MSDDMSSSVRNEPRSRDLSGIDEVASVVCGFFAKERCLEHREGQVLGSLVLGSLVA